jgi:hypothetical protein
VQHLDVPVWLWPPCVDAGVTHLSERDGGIGVCVHDRTASGRCSSVPKATAPSDNLSHSCEADVTGEAS